MPGCTYFLEKNFIQKKKTIRRTFFNKFEITKILRLPSLILSIFPEKVLKLLFSKNLLAKPSHLQ